MVFFSITITCYKWLPLIEKVNGYDIVYNWFDHLKSRGHFIIGYVIMPNHLHAVIAFRNTGGQINTIIGNGKRFMAYEIINRLTANKETELLCQLSSAVEATRRSNQKIHEVWELSFDWKHCTDERFIVQKLDYFHINPCKGKWSLCESPADYIHSSAKYYVTGEQGAYAVSSYNEVLEVDLTKMHLAP